MYWTIHLGVIFDSTISAIPYSDLQILHCLAQCKIPRFIVEIYELIIFLFSDWFSSDVGVAIDPGPSWSVRRHWQWRFCWGAELSQSVYTSVASWHARPAIHGKKLLFNSFLRYCLFFTWSTCFEFSHFRFLTKRTLILRKEEIVAWSSLSLLYFLLHTNLLFFIKKCKMK